VRLPRDLSGADLIRGLQRLGYGVTRQTGSHVRLTLTGDPQHHVTVPLHDPLRLGTLAAILADVAAFHGIDRDELMRRLDGR
jgi:predicted RNA binding protein YcfA (HicA-like mRNA interferase family)